MFTFIATKETMLVVAIVVTCSIIVQFIIARKLLTSLKQTLMLCSFDLLTNTIIVYTAIVLLNDRYGLLFSMFVLSAFMFHIRQGIHGEKQDDPKVFSSMVMSLCTILFALFSMFDVVL